MLGAESQRIMERANFEILLHSQDLRGQSQSNGVLGLELPFSWNPRSFPNIEYLCALHKF